MQSVWKNGKEEAVMLKNLRIKNFKSWEDSQKINFSKATGFFGANSSGKSAILQFLLMLIQTVRSTSRDNLLNLGDVNSNFYLGGFQDVIFKHELNRVLEFLLDWDTKLSITVDGNPFSSNSVSLKAGFRGTGNPQEGIPVHMILDAILYQVGKLRLGLDLVNPESSGNALLDLIEAEERRYCFKINIANSKLNDQTLPQPSRFYEFPEELYDHYQAPIDFSKPANRFTDLIKNMFYVGPLREPPKPYYSFSGTQTLEVGFRGESVIPAILSRRSYIKDPSSNLEQEVAEALRRIGLIHSFRVRPVGEKSSQYEILIRQDVNSPEVHLNEVGFGISQILPIIVQCYAAPKGSILIFEQPELHLHPAIQYELGDLFIDVANDPDRDLQIIFESHSEHLLQRFQRRVAEGSFAQQDALMYFTQLKDGKSQIEQLNMDQYGNITNWPKEFFGDLMGEVSARALAAIDREIEDRNK